MVLGLAACAGAGTQEQGAKDAAPNMSASAEGSSRPPSPPSSAATSDVTEAAAPELPTGEPELARFQAALRDLAQGSRKEHVRVLWFGDSHGQADFWTGALRDALQKRFGKAGPGFVHLGWKAYRHDGVKLALEGKWTIGPKQPAASSKTGDGAFGLGGVVTQGPAGSGFARVHVTDEALAGQRLSLDLCYRLRTKQDELKVTLGAGPATKIRATATEPPGEIRHLVLASTAPVTMHVAPTNGEPELCGVVIETDPGVKPGVVLDTLGINGARLGTPLAWEEAQFGAELVRRKPELVVIEYGTNEAGDHNVDPAKYTQRFVRLLERIKKFAPQTSCVALSPTDRKDARERTPLVRDAIREGARLAGCSFWDTYAVMGGEGSIKAWASEAQPRATNDGVHLTPRGYRELGELLATHLLKGLPE